VKLLVDGEEPRPHQEVIYDLEGGAREHGNQARRTRCRTMPSSECRRCCRSGPSRRRPAEVCQDLAISPKVLSYWEKRRWRRCSKRWRRRRASNRTRAEPEIERLLARQVVQQKGRMAKLEKRLAKLQEPKSPPPTK